MNRLREGFVEAGTARQPIDERLITQLIKTGVNLEAFGGTLTVSTDGTSILLDVLDPTGPNGTRSFIIEVRKPRAM